MQTSVTGGEAVWVQIPLENPILLGISPDRTQMLLTTRGEYGEKHPLWIMPIQGGPPQRVGDVMVDSAGWFKDGQRLLCTADHEVFSVERDGTQRRHLFNVNGVPFRFSWRPDGSSVRFSVVEASNVITLWDASADGSNVHPVLPGWNVHPNECCGSWSADGQNYVFRANRDGQEDLWLLHEAPGWPWSARPRPVRLTNGPTSFSEPVVSQDGRKIFATGLEVHGYVAHLDPMSGQLSRAPLPENAFDLTFSHDGKWVAYIAPPGLTLWRSRIDGSEKLQLTMPPFSALTPRWSPDDTKLVFTGARGHDSHQTYIVAANGGALERVIENDTLYRTYPDWSPDQQSLIVGISSVIHAPDAGITLVDLKTHRISELPGSKGLAYPRWSPRGNYIAAATQDFKKIFLFDVRSQTWKQMATTTQFWKFEWERDGSYLYYQDIRDPAQTTFRLDPSTGAVTQLANCTAFHQDGAIRCSFEGRAPDGSLTFSVRASWANLYAFDVELP
jgi:Tol biopolymer transport system component